MNTFFIARIAILLIVIPMVNSIFIVKQYGPYSLLGSDEVFIPHLSQAEILKNVNQLFEIFFFLVLLISGFDSLFFYLDRIEKRYIIFDIMARYSLGSYIKRLLGFLSYYNLVYYLLTGIYLGLILYNIGLGSMLISLKMGFIMGFGLFAIWIGCFYVSIGVAKDKTIGIMIYTIIAMALILYEIFSKSSGIMGLLNLASLYSLPANIIVEASIEGYSLTSLLAFTVLGFIIGLIGVSRYEIR